MSGNAERLIMERNPEDWIVGYTECTSCGYIVPIIVSYEWQRLTIHGSPVELIKEEYFERYQSVYEAQPNDDYAMRHAVCNGLARIVSVQDFER